MQRRTLVLGGACGLALAAMPALAAEAVDPFEWIVALNNSILDEIRADPKLHSGDQTALQALVDRRVMAAADFAMMTRMTIGPKWRKATKEERQRLMDGFEKLLIRVYSGALKTVTDHKCELRPTRNRTIKDEMVIRTILKSTGNPDIGIDFRSTATRRASGRSSTSTSRASGWSRTTARSSPPPSTPKEFPV